MKIYILALFLLFKLTSCQKNIDNKNNISTSIHKEKDLLNFINFPIDDLEGITSTRYDGVYRNFDYKYYNGETTFILVPKIGSDKWYKLQENIYKNQDVDNAIEKQLNSQTFKNLSKTFNIFIFHTPKEYLKQTPNMDSPYSPVIPRKIFLYQYNNSDNKWTKLNTFSVNTYDDELKENDWRENITSKFVSKVNNSISSFEEWEGVYINSDDMTLTSYQELKNRIGWYELTISSTEITFKNDRRMESDFPIESPGGYSINYICDYNISDNTLKIYEKEESEVKKSKKPKSVSGNGQKLILTITKKDNKYYAISSDIKTAEDLVNSARVKSKTPYEFYKFNLDSKN